MATRDFLIMAIKNRTEYLDMYKIKETVTNLLTLKQLLVFFSLLLLAFALLP